MNRHFAEMLSALSGAGAEYLIIGANAVAAHGYVRATKDLDILVRATPANAARVWQALADFGAPLEDVTREDLHTPGMVLQIGVEPVRIDILTEAAGIDFDVAWSNRIEIDGYWYIGKDDLIRAKRAAGRPQDMVDAETLERQ